MRIHPHNKVSCFLGRKLGKKLMQVSIFTDLRYEYSLISQKYSLHCLLVYNLPLCAFFTIVSKITDV